MKILRSFVAVGQYQMTLGFTLSALLACVIYAPKSSAVDVPAAESLKLNASTLAAAKPSSQSKPSVIRLNADALVQTRAQLLAGDRLRQAAGLQVQREAKKLLNQKPFTIVNKTILPASGNPHDYFSFAPYWWPNPDTADGMPWIQLDGKINPASRDSLSDKVAFNGLVNATQTLSEAYFFSGKKVYAHKAAELLRVWFLAEDTKMNPHLNYAQAIPGAFDGRDIGIIDSRLLYRVVDSIELIAASGALTKTELAGLRQWFSDYVDWLVKSPLGIGESKKKNNHGTFYDLQVVAFARFSGRDDVARAAIVKTQARLVQQIDAQGQQPLELERTRPFHYSVFNLQAFFAVAKMAQDLGIDLWRYPTAADARVKVAMEYLLKRMQRETFWGGTEEPEIAQDIMVPLVLEYLSQYGATLDTSTYALAQKIAQGHAQWDACSLLFANDFGALKPAPSSQSFKPCFY
jgi:hypothetical protein